MTSPNKHQTITTTRVNKLIDPYRVRWFGLITVVYILLLLLIIPLIGVTVTSLIATPVWGFLYLIYSKWESVSASPDEINWRQLLKPPPINYWNILCIVLTIFSFQFLMSLPFSIYVDVFRPELSSALPDDFAKAFDKLTDDWQVVISLLAGAYAGHFAGGYVAGKLRNPKCPAPYRHAFLGSFIFNLVSYGFFTPLFLAEGIISTPSINEIGPILVFPFTVFIFSAGGVKLAIRKRSKQDASQLIQPVSDGKPDSAQITAGDVHRKHDTLPARSSTRVRRNRRVSRRKYKRQGVGTPAASANQTPAQVTPDILQEQLPEAPGGWSYRRFAITLVSAALVGVAGTIILRTYESNTGGTNCPNPPVTATLNYWPVTYSAPAEACHDYQSVDAGLVNGGHLSRSQEEWERGLAAKAGNEIYVLIYINNGAVDNAEENHPGLGIARNVRLTTEISPERSTVHYVKVRFAGDNTNTVVNQFKITTETQERLEVVQESGTIFNYQGIEIIAKDLNIGNNTIVVGDLPPKWESSIFVSFKLKVVV